MTKDISPPKDASKAVLYAAPGKVGLKIAGGIMQMTPEQARVLSENLIELAFLADQLESRPAQAAARAPVDNTGYPTSLRRPPALIQ